MTERWRAIPGWAGFYEVSTTGRVRSAQRSVEGRPGVLLNLRTRILRGSWSSDGYLSVALCRGGRKTTERVHRLVLLAFVGPPPVGHEACHNDGDKSTNTLTNLRWDTRSGNTHDRIKHGSHSQARKTHCPQGHPYDQANTYRTSYGRFCRTCRTAAKRRFNARKAAA